MLNEGVHPEIDFFPDRTLLHASRLMVKSFRISRKRLCMTVIVDFSSVLMLPSAIVIIPPWSDAWSSSPITRMPICRKHPTNTLLSSNINILNVAPNVFSSRSGSSTGKRCLLTFKVGSTAAFHSESIAAMPASIIMTFTGFLRFIAMAEQHGLLCLSCPIKWFTRHKNHMEQNWRTFISCSQLLFPLRMPSLIYRSRP